jgi:hypothetical protein
MDRMLIESHCIFAAADILKTAEYYEKRLKFRVENYMDAKEPHICLYRDTTEIILIQAGGTVHTNRELYGYGYDAYFITDRQAELQTEMIQAGIRIVRPLATTDYRNAEFVIEDIDGRWIAFGMKKR